MATLATPTRIGSTSYSGGSGNYTQQLQIYTFNTTSGSPQYCHFKTNTLNSGSTAIITIEALGFNYGVVLPIRCSWSYYCESGVLYDRGRVNKTAGLDAHGMYVSSDNYVCLRAYNASSLYFAGWVFNAYVNAWYYTDNIQITAANQNSTSGNYY